MTDERFLDRIGRKTIVTGHYGSGKTEFAVSLAMRIVADSNMPHGGKGEVHSHRELTSFALIDLDIVNPYFRSRQEREMLENAGIEVHGSAFDKESTAEIPALGASLRAPLENKTCRVIIDTGGNDAGALVLNQFTKYFTDDETTVLAIVNANRPDTSDIQGALEHITAIEKITKLTISYIVNNTHLLRETTAADIIRGHAFCDNICGVTGKSFLCNCYPKGVVDPDELTGLSGNLMPLGLYMRPTWLDK